MRAELYDAGTKLLKGNYGGGSMLDVHAQPGMQYGSFRELDFEYDHRDAIDRIPEINWALIEEPTTTTLQPWPKPFPARMWVDNTTRYDNVVGGPVLTVYHEDVYGLAAYEEVAAHRTALVDLLRKEEVERVDARVSAMPTVDQIQARNPAPTEWLRLDLENEKGAGYTDLREQLVMMHHTDKEGGRVTMSMDYNAIFAPFDLREPSWYKVLDADGAVLAETPEDVAKLAAFAPDGFYRLYLRPASWRWVMTVVASYLYVSYFEMFPTQEVFTQAFYQRPPIYTPRRHDLLHPFYIIDVNGVPHDWDAAINDAWDLSRASAFMAHMIIDAQWHSLSEAYIFTGNDPGSMVITMYPPANNDVVLGVGRVDYPGGAEEVVWFKQVVDGEAAAGWAPTLLDTFYIPWFVTP